MTRSRWDEALEAYYAEHDRIGTGADARGPALLVIGPEDRCRRDRGGHARTVRQTHSHDPAGHHDWVLEAVVDCDASDEAGELVLAVVR